MNCHSIRVDFPEIIERGLVYLDSAASSLKPIQVVEAMRSFSKLRYANVHRGAYRVSLEASKAYEDAHEIVGKHINAWSWEEVIFTRNTTEAIQLAALTLLTNGFISEGSEIIVSESEHHSNLLPWVRIARLAKAKIKLIPVNSEGIPRWDILEDLISEKTRVVSVGHVSNVTGYKSDVRRIAEIAHKYGSLVVVDGAQSVPHMKVNVRELNIDFLAFSGHKMLGPTGIGVLWGRLEYLNKLEPPLGGGGTVRRVKLESNNVNIEWNNPPWRFEAGTPPIIEAIGLSEAVSYLSRIGMENVESHERILTEYTLSRLGELEGVRILGPRDSSRRLGIVSFNVRSIDPSMVGAWLDSYNIAVRSGLHCAHILHDKLGESNGSVRASFYIYNCREDIDKLIDALKELIVKVSRS
ncbi:MAG: cysteine desulfurase [Acidilobaceae archaeon]